MKDKRNIELIKNSMKNIASICAEEFKENESDWECCVGCPMDKVCGEVFVYPKNWNVEDESKTE